ncbi:non-claret disjunctional-like [Planoprotostelium fungivorum]|nr:non-claret disjunctional-like [Planoprotostelium fungivorum]
MFNRPKEYKPTLAAANDEEPAVSRKAINTKKMSADLGLNSEDDDWEEADADVTFLSSDEDDGPPVFGNPLLNKPVVSNGIVPPKSDPQEAEIASLRKQLDQLRRENNENLRGKNEAVNKLDNLEQSSRSQLNIFKSKMEKQLEARNTEIDDLTTAQEESEFVISQLKEALKKAKNGEKVDDDFEPAVAVTTKKQAEPSESNGISEKELKEAEEKHQKEVKELKEKQNEALSEKKSAAEIQQLHSQMELYKNQPQSDPQEAIDRAKLQEAIQQQNILKDELATKQREADELKRQLNELNERLHSISTQSDRGHEEADRLKHESTAQLQKLKSQHEVELAQLRERLKTDINQRDEHHQKETEHLNIQISSLREEMVSLTSGQQKDQDEAAAIAAKKIRDQNAEIESLSAQLAEEKNRLYLETQRMQLDLTESKQKILHASQEQTRLMDELVASKQKLTHMETERERIAALNEQLEDERSRLEITLQTEKTSMQQMMSSMTSSGQQQTVSLQQEIAALTAKNLNLEREVEKREQKHQEDQASIGQQKQSIAKLEAQLESTRSFSTKLQEERDTFEHDKKMVEQELMVERQQLTQSKLDGAHKSQTFQAKLAEELQRFQEAQKTHHAELTTEKQNHASTLSQLQTQHEGEIQSMKDNHEAEVRKLNAHAQKTQESHAAELSQLKGDHTAAVQKSQDEHSVQIQQLNETHSSSKQQLQAQHAAQVQQLRAELETSKESHTTEVTRLKDSHASESQKLRGDHASQIEKMKTEHANLSSQASQQHREELKTHVQSVELYKSHTLSMQTEIQDIRKLHASTVEAAKLNHKSIGPLLASIIEQVTQANQKQSKEFQVMLKRYKKEVNKNRKLYNEIQELKGNIRVYCRVRPLSSDEQANADPVAIKFPEDDQLVLSHNNQKKIYEFERVFTPQSSQEDVFRDTQPLVTSVLDGFNVCIFAYGQTGSGKTFTMEGPRDNPGVNSRALSELFKIVEERGEDYRIDATVSILEIYNEAIHDLLIPAAKARSKKLDIKQGPEGMHVPELTSVTVRNAEEVVTLGGKNRATSSTNMNEHSSRSHLVLMISVRCQNLLTGEKAFGKLTLVDLAGSERLDKSGAAATEERLKEAQAINKSLSALGNVIAALQNKEKHIPYRDCKLTYLLQDSLGGNSKTLMFVNVGPASSNTGETTCSLNFAQRVRNVELGKAQATKDTGSAEMKTYIKKLEDAITTGGLPLPISSPRITTSGTVSGTSSPAAPSTPKKVKKPV